MKSNLLLYLFLIGIFSGCEGIMHINGKIISNQTNKPIDSVKIIYKEDRHTIVVYDTLYSDKNGEFEFINPTMAVPKSPKITLYLYKIGYKETVIDFPTKMLDTLLEVKMTAK